MKAPQFLKHLVEAIKEEGVDVWSDADVAEDKVEAVANNFLVKIGVKKSAEPEK